VKLTEILADELAPYHVRVNAISPGGVNTFMLQEVLKMGEKKAGASELKSAKERAKKGGVAPEVPAGLAVFLASDDSIGLSGRMISAPFDDWKKWNKTAIKKIMATDAFKLRRVNIKK
jgi:3-oxoacyl-[acyl-carrier protein] reductase